MNHSSTPDSAPEHTAGPFADLGQTAPSAGEPPPQASDVGTLLCATRMRVSKDLQDVAAVLHIRYNFLVAIEDGRYEDLPGQAYAIGFVRAYADHLGLDGDEVVRRYKEETAGIKRATRYEYPIPAPESGIPSGALLLIAVVLGMMVYGVWYSMADADRRAADVIQEVPERLAALLKDETAVAEPAEPTLEPETDVAELAPVDDAEPEALVEAPVAAPAQAEQKPAVTAPVQVAAVPPAPAPQVQTPPAQAPVKTLEPVAAPPSSTPAATAKPAAPTPTPTPATAAPAVATPKPAATAPVVAAAPQATPPPVVTTPAVTAPAVPTPKAPTAQTPPAQTPPAQTPPAPATTTPTTTAAAPAATPPVQKPAATTPVQKPAPAATTVAAVPTAPAATAPTSAAPTPTAQKPPAATAPSAPVAASVTPPAAKAPSTAAPVATPAPKTEPATPPPVTSRATVLAAKPPAAASGTGGRNAVELRAKSDSWIQVRDGEQLLLTRFLRKGEVYKVPERSGLTLMTLNAGGIEIMVDGELMPSLGDPGSVARGVVLDAQKLKAQPKPAPARPAEAPANN